MVKLELKKVLNLDPFQHLNLILKEDINLIKLKKAIYISDIKKEQEITKLLSTIINSNSVWKQHALKFLGDFYSSNQQIEKAKQYYSLININNNNNDKQK